MNARLERFRNWLILKLTQAKNWFNSNQKREQFGNWFTVKHEMSGEGVDPPPLWFAWEAPTYWGYLLAGIVIGAGLLVLAYCAVQGVLLPSECGFPFSAFAVFLGLTDQPAVPCLSYPLLSDAPSLLLAATSLYTALLHARLRRYYFGFSAVLEARDIMTAADFKDYEQVLDAADNASRWQRIWVQLERGATYFAGTRWTGFALFIAVFVLGYSLMYPAYENGYIFQIISKGDPVNLVRLREEWWASDSGATSLMRVTWSVIGSVGVVAALRNIAMNIVFTRVIGRVQCATIKYQVNWFPSDSPWSIFTRVVNVKVYGFASVIFALVGLMYVLGKPGQNSVYNYVLLVVAIGATALFVGQYLPSKRHVKLIYMKALKTEIAQVHADIEEVGRPTDIASAMRLTSAYARLDQVSRMSAPSGAASARPLLAILVPVISAISTLARLFLAK